MPFYYSFSYIFAGQKGKNISQLLSSVPTANTDGRGTVQGEQLYNYKIS